MNDPTKMKWHSEMMQRTRFLRSGPPKELPKEKILEHVRLIEDGNHKIHRDIIVNYKLKDVEATIIK